MRGKRPCCKADAPCEWSLDTGFRRYDGNYAEVSFGGNCGWLGEATYEDEKVRGLPGASLPQTVRAVGPRLREDDGGEAAR